LVVEFFTLESFRRIPQGWNGLHFQSLILRKPSSAGPLPSAGVAQSRR
jgi:hypothetical protein